MELVGPHQVLGLLGDLPVLGGKQLRGDGGIQNVPQHLSDWPAPALRLPGHQMPHQGFGDGGVDGVHGHVVAVIGGPAQGQLGQVPGADDQPPPLVGQIHEHLGALPGLGVFKGDAVVVHGLADVGKVPLHRRADVHLHKLRPQLPGQQLRVGAGAAGGAEAGHGDS